MSSFSCVQAKVNYNADYVIGAVPCQVGLLYAQSLVTEGRGRLRLALRYDVYGEQSPLPGR